jgi:hypothetical protein
MSRDSKECISLCNLNQFAKVHDTNSVRDMADNIQSMCNKEIGQAQSVLQVTQEIDDLRLYRDIEGRDRFISDYESGMERDTASNTDTLSLTTGKFMWVAVATARIESHQL